MSDIRKHAVSETSVLHLRDSADELMFADDDPEKPMKVTLYGPGSKKFAKAQASNQNRMLDKLKKKGRADQTAEEKAAESADFLAECTESMSNIEYEKLTGSAMFKAVYADISIGFVAEQVGKHLGDWANFTKGAQKN